MLIKEKLQNKYLLIHFILISSKYIYSNIYILLREDYIYYNQSVSSSKSHLLIEQLNKLTLMKCSYCQFEQINFKFRKQWETKHHLCYNCYSDLCKLDRIQFSSQTGNQKSINMRSQKQKQTKPNLNDYCKCKQKLILINNGKLEKNNTQNRKLNSVQFNSYSQCYFCKKDSNQVKLQVQGNRLERSKSFIDCDENYEFDQNQDPSESSMNNNNQNKGLSFSDCQLSGNQSKFQKQTIGRGGQINALCQNKKIPYHQNHYNNGNSKDNQIQQREENSSSLKIVNINLENEIIDYTLKQPTKYSKVQSLRTDHCQFLIKNSKKHQVSFEIMKQLNEFINSGKYLNQLGQDGYKQNDYKSKLKGQKNNNIEILQSKCSNCNGKDYFLNLGCLCQLCFTKYLMGQQVKIINLQQSIQTTIQTSKQYSQIEKTNNHQKSSKNKMNLLNY